MQRRPATQVTQRIEHKHGYVRIKWRAIVSHALVLPMHRARGRAQARAAGVFEALAGFKRWLLAHHARAFDFFRHTVGVVDVPSAREELRCDVACIGDRDGVSKAKHAHAGRGLLWQILRADLNSKLWAAHGCRCYRERRSGA